MGQSKPHIVVVPLPTRGHVNPMMHFSKLLAARGVTITFLNTEFNSKLVVDSQKPSELQKAGLDIRFVELPDGLPPHLDRTTDVIALCESVLSTMGAPFENLLASLMLQDPPVSCILADTWMLFALEAATKFGLPHANFWTQSAASFASVLMVTKGYRPPKEPQIPGASFLKAIDLNTFVQCYDPSDFMFRFVTGGFDRLSQSRWIFMDTFDELEPETLEALTREEQLHTIKAVGPLLPPSFLNHNKHKDSDPINDDTATLWAEEESCLTWLDKFEPNSVLYVAFGSLALVSSEQIEEIALGLEASGYPFLWVTRPNLIYGESPNFGESFFERVKARAHFVPWAPQLKVLGHKAVGGFFTHGGWNSTLEGITAGVPMLGWPYFSDQPMDCKCIEQQWKLGLRLREEEDPSKEELVSRTMVETKVKALMSSTEFRERALHWSSLAKKAALHGGSSFNNIQSFVESLKSPS